MRIFLFALLLACLSSGASAALQPADTVFTVVKIIDGDTFDLNAGDSTFRVRLYGIDAPEKGQEFFRESANFLGDLTLEKQVILQAKGKDKYGRILAVIVRRSDRLNVNSEMVRRGMAWYFDRYSTDPELAKLQTEAQKKEIGLWSLYHFTEPWEYRKHN